MNTRTLAASTALIAMLLNLAATAQAPGAPSANVVAAPRAPAPTLKTPTNTTAKVDAAGFLRRWLLLDPIPVSGQLTMDAVDKALRDKPFPGGAWPYAGQSAPWAGADQRWHAVDTTLHNVNLYHFAWAQSRPTSNILVWAVAVVDAPREMKNVRLAICSNAASVWWFNEERVIALYNDRQSVIDDGVSKRVTLRAGANTVRAAILNGGGATDFCARFLDEQDQPIRNLSVRLTAP